MIHYKTIVNSNTLQNDLISAHVNKSGKKLLFKQKFCDISILI